ncbi:MAG: CBS domain-containing protein [Methanomicrobia archaeon]|nr:CBS domain-containing protein [Methanomicrobia archaeon]
MATEMLEVGDVMTPEVIAEDEKTRVTKLSTEMEMAGIGSVVITREGKPVGIVTDRDIALKVCAMKRNPDDVTAKEIMSSPLLTIEPDASLEKACKLMADKGIRRLPVVEGDTLVGIISVRNILTRNPTCVHKFYPTE